MLCIEMLASTASAGRRIIKAINVMGVAAIATETLEALSVPIPVEGQAATCSTPPSPIRPAKCEKLAHAECRSRRP